MATPVAPDHSSAIFKMVEQGITSADLAQLLGLDLQTTESRLATSGVKPLRGTQQRSRVYDMWSAMSALRGAGEGIDVAQLEATISKMRPSQLPPALQLEFWKAQSERNKYLEANGQLWKTERVQKLVSSIYKVVRQNMVLMEDNVDRQTSLTAEQARIIRGIADATLGETKEVIIDALEKWSGNDRETDTPHI